MGGWRGTGFGNFGAAVMALAVGIVMAGTQPLPGQGDDYNGMRVVTRHRRKGKGQNNCRGKGTLDRPKRRRNMMTVSKRVRRKHRRAA